MAGYWLHGRTPDSPPPIPKLYEETIDSYDTFKRRIDELNKANPDYEQIYVLFTGNIEGGTARTWCPECNLFEEVLEFLKPKVKAHGHILKVRVGSPEEWRNPKNPFKVDHRLGITQIPTLIVWNTMKQISGSQAFQIRNILTMFDD